MEDNPWRHGEQPPMNWPNMAAGAAGQPQQWAHHSPQAAQGRRNPWDANSLAENLNEALGLSGPPGGAPAWAPGQPGAGGDFNSVKQLWNDPNMAPVDHHMHHGHMQPYPQGGMMNGMMDPNAVPAGEWGMRGGEQQMWSDPLKQDDQYWKQQQQQQQGWGGQGGGGQGPPRWPPQMGGAPPPHHRGAPMGVRPGGGGGWPGAGAPNGMMGGGGPKPPMWNDGGHRGMGGGGGGMGGGRGGHRGGGNYQPRGMDMSVPPPIDMGMMQRGPPPGNHMWKPEGAGMGGPNGGMRGGGGQGGGGYGGVQGGAMQQMGNFMGNKQPIGEFQQFEDDGSMGKFSMGGNGGGGGQAQDDLMWHDPNGELKKWQRDTGVSAWGDPDKAALRPIQNWIIGENEEEDLETALSRCPVPPKRTEALTAPLAPGEENAGPATTSTALPYNPRLPPIPSGKRTIVVTGWGDLPDNDPNNPNKIDAPGEKWGEAGQSDAAWYLPNNAAGAEGAGGGQWSAGGGPFNVSRMLGNGAQNTEAIADQLRIAVEKGYLDMAVLTQHHLPPTVLAHMNSMLAKIPALEEAESALEAFVESGRPPGDMDNNSPPTWLNDVQMPEYNRLVIAVTTAKIEVSDLSKKMQIAMAELREQGVLPAADAAPQAPAAGESTHDNYQYSFLG